MYIADHLQESMLVSRALKGQPNIPVSEKLYELDYDQGKLNVRMKLTASIKSIMNSGNSHDIICLDNCY